MQVEQSGGQFFNLCKCRRDLKRCHSAKCCKDNDKIFLFQVAIAFPASWKLYNSRYMLWTRVWKRCRRWKIFELDCEDVVGVVRWIARGRGECVSLYWMYHNVSLYWWRFMYHNVLAFITSSSFSQIFI